MRRVRQRLLGASSKTHASQRTVFSGSAHHILGARVSGNLIAPRAGHCQEFQQLSEGLLQPTGYQPQNREGARPHRAAHSARPRRQGDRASIDPVLMIRMLIVGYVFAIRSERRICAEPPKQVSLTDPQAAWVTRKGIDPFFAYDANYLIDNKVGIILDAEGTRANRKEIVQPERVAV